MGFLDPIIAPIIVLYNVFYVPIMYRIVPLGFFVGMFLMAALMSLAQLFFCGGVQPGFMVCGSVSITSWSCSGRCPWLGSPSGNQLGTVPPC